MLCLAMATLLSAAASAQDKAEKKLYCWSENGQQSVRHAAASRWTTREPDQSKSGMRVGKFRAVDQATPGPQSRRSRPPEAEEEAARARDLAMHSYATRPTARAYGERITLVEESLKTSRLGVVNLRQSLLSLLRKAAELELQAKPVNKALTDNIQSQHADLLRQQAIMQKQQVDRASLGSDLEDALARYRAMKVPAQG